jgi:NADH:ubiquinone oxidoreductase subunit 6 (subunit J)
MKVNENDFSISSTGEKAVEYSKDIMLVRIAEKEKTRRLLIIISAVMVLIAAVIMAFGPEERQGANMIIGIVLLVFAMGSIGASQFVIKGGGVEVGTKETEKQANTLEDSFWKNQELE